MVKYIVISILILFNFEFHSQYQNLPKEKLNDQSDVDEDLKFVKEQAMVVLEPEFSTGDVYSDNLNIQIVKKNLNGQEKPIFGASNLIPQPQNCTEKSGIFTLEGITKLIAPKEFSEVARLLRDEMKINLDKNKKEKIIELIKSKDNLDGEKYRLIITPSKISIYAANVRGAITAVFTLLQLQKLQPDTNLIPCAKIEDAPRFVYRGMHLDVSRHFYPVSFIKKYLDIMALYKFNTFHWHLTDSPGWRLQINKYPLLTSQSGFRNYAHWTDWTKNGSHFVPEGSPNGYGGYYTQDEAKEIVAYAKQRNITVIPEIEMPGHSYEVLAAYPELSCTNDPNTCHEFCIGNPRTLEFLKDILTEVIAIFPSRYIHIGGDEAGTHCWKKCSKCQDLKVKKGFNDENELQSYLISNIEQFLKSRGRKLIGWDEIIEGGLPADATVMSWRGEKGGIIAAEQNHDVIMTPGACYLDAYQSNPVTQPMAIGGFLPIQNVYNYEPVPAQLSVEKAKYILGLQACLWTEYMSTTYQVEYMAFPRALAIAETGWTQKSLKNYDHFHKRIQAHYLLLQRMHVNYYRPSTFLTISEQPNADHSASELTLVSELYKPDIRYTTDGSSPTLSSQTYTKPVEVKGKMEIKSAIFQNGQMLGKETSYTSSHHRAIGKKVTFNNDWSTSYPAQSERTLTNGVMGSFTYQDKQWLGYLKDLDVTVDMETVQPVSEVSIRFMQQIGPGVFLPSHVDILVSEDGVKYVNVKRIIHDISNKNPELILKKFDAVLESISARYIRIIAPNIHGGYMFTDEIMVY